MATKTVTTAPQPVDVDDDGDIDAVVSHSATVSIPDSPAPAPPPAPAPAPVVQGCGTPNCTGAKKYEPAALTVTANTATGRTRVFTAVSPGGCLPKNLVWDFGDGSRAVGPSPMSHTFAGTGTSFSVAVAPQNSTRSKASAPLAVTIT